VDAQTEADLVKSAKDGDRSAFKELFLSHSGRMNATARALMGNRADGLDVAQEAWIKAWKNLGTYNFESRLGTWLHRIVVNTGLDHLRKRQRLQERFVAVAAEECAPPVAPESEPAHQLEAKERHEKLASAVARLPDLQRVVLVLREFEVYSYDEIARELGIARGTVMSRLHTARQKLMELYSKEA
jgi:RNA polymerase sigma-70 factor (ECF subfamily)